MRPLRRAALLLLAASLLGCDGGSSNPPAADVGAPAADVGAPTDAGADAAASDVGQVAGPDVAPDAVADVAPDASPDGGAGPVGTFPPSFLLGAATAGFQVDMGCPTLPDEVCVDDASDWYAFVTAPETRESPSAFVAGEDPAVAGPGHWELYEADYDLLRDGLNGDAFRLSIEWSRLFPTSTEGIEGHEALRAAADPDALATYHAMFAALRARGVTPFVTLHHYTLPLWIHDGVGCHVDYDGCVDRGWLEPERIVPEIAKYAGFVGREFGGDVDWWGTLNEPFAVVLSGWLQPSETRSNPPSVAMRAEDARMAMVAMIEAHARMVDAVRANDTEDADGDGAPALLGLVHAMTPVQPQDPTAPLDVAAAENAFYLWNLTFLDATAAGVLDADLDGVGQHRAHLADRMDFVGLNYKQTLRVQGTAGSLLPELSPLLTLNPLSVDLSQVHPRGLVEIAALIEARYGLPIVITENNGQALWQGDEATERRRLVELLQWCEEALARGIDLRGWFYWSLLDNYEWNHGMGVKLGLWAVDATDSAKPRTPRSTVPLLARIFAARGVPADLAAEHQIDRDAPPTGGVPDRFLAPPAPTPWRGTIGGDRPAGASVPTDYDPDGRYPLVVVLHGYGVNGFLQTAYLGLARRVNERGFVLLSPDGTRNADGDRFWNATDCCGDGSVDDEGYLLALIDEAARTWSIDTDRVYLVGHSNGGMMAHRMACRAADRIAAIASIAGATYADPADCAPTAPVSVLNVHGTEDDAVPYDGSGRFPSADESTAVWVGHDACPAEPTALPPIDIDNEVDGAETARREWAPCAADTAVALWTMEGADHDPAFPPAFSAALLDWLFAR